MAETAAPSKPPVAGVEGLLRWSVLGVALGLSCLLGMLSSYVLLLLAILAAGYLVWRQGLVFTGTAAGFALGFIGLAALFILTAQQPYDAVYALNFITLLAFAPFDTLMRRAPSSANSTTVAALALGGTASATMLALVQVAVFQLDRAGTLVTDPIRLANTALILGFLALIGVRSHGSPARWLFLLGPVLAMATIVFSGSRGPLLAVPPLLLVAVLMLVRHRLAALALVAAGIMAMAAGLVFADRFGIRAASLFNVVTGMMPGGTLQDETARIRFELYKAGWAAFEQAPLIGHGWAHMMSSVEPFLAEADRINVRLPHLHNEVLTFAVSGGLVGVLIYFMLLALPLAACVRTPRDGQYGFRLYGCVVLTVSYAVLGLPDTMLGFELHTALFVVWTAIILGFCRDPAQAP